MTDCTIETTTNASENEFWAGLWAKIATSMNHRAKQRADRIAFKHMLALSPEILKDIGVSRGDIMWAANLPIEKNAAIELEKVARNMH